MKKFLLLTISTFLVLNCIAQPGTIDHTFNPNAFTGANGTINTTIIQSSKIIISGSFTKFNIHDRNGLARLNSDGTIDTTFVPTSGANNTIHTTLGLSSSKLLIAGDFTSYNGTACNKVARVNNDGSIDNTFNIGTGANSSIYASGKQSTNKIIIGGDFTSFNGNTVNRLARLNTDGSFDTGFNTNIGAGVNGIIKSIAVIFNDKIYIVGDFTSVAGVSKNRIAVLNSNGSLDNTFDPGLGANGLIRTVVVEGTGKIIIGGDFTSYNGVARNKIARLNSNGTLDTGFDPGTGANDYISSVSVSSLDTKVVISGAFTSYNGTNINHVACLNSNGSINTSFIPGSAANNTVNSIIRQSDGKILMSGSFTSFNDHERNRITRINTDGSIDLTFELPGLENRAVISLQNDEKIIISGQIQQYNSIPINGMCRLNENGSIDTSFNAPPELNSIIAHAFLPDGKILVGGTFNTNGGSSTNGIARLNADGTLDQTFNPGSGIGPVNGDFIQTIVLQDDGKILIGGAFSTFNGSSRKNIARLNSDGSLDNTFSVGTGFNSSVNTIYLLSNGQILIAGDFLQYNGTTMRKIARLNSNGSLDITFNPGNQNSNTSIYTILIQNDGKIILSGRFTSFNDVNKNRIVRINTDGSIDPSFDIGTGANDDISKSFLQQDGKIIIAGEFTTYNGSAAPRIVRLNTDGSLDTGFDPGLGPDDKIDNAGALQSDGKIIVSGDFLRYDGTGRDHIVRINGDNTSITISENILSNELIIYPNPSSGSFSVVTQTTKGFYQLHDVTGKLLLSGNVTTAKFSLDLSAFSKGIYLLSIIDGEQQLNRKIVKE